MCKVSIIMPVYNKEKYIKKAIQSVLAQTMQDWELLIIDDGSTDTSFEICSSFKDERIKAVHVENGGVSSARNIGLDMAKGEYVTFVDGDDTISSLYLESLVISGSQLVISGLSRKNDNGDIINEVFPFYEGKYSVNKLYKEFYRQELANGIYGFVAGKMVKRSIIENNQIRFDERICLAEDYDFFLKVYQCIDEIIFIKKSYYFYLDVNGCDFNVKPEDIPSQLKIQMRTRIFLKKHDGFSEEDEKIMSKRVGGLIYTYLIVNNFVQYNSFKEYIEKIREVDVELRYDTDSWYGKIVLNLFRQERDYILYLIICIRKLIRNIG